MRKKVAPAFLPSSSLPTLHLHTSQPLRHPPYSPPPSFCPRLVLGFWRASLQTPELPTSKSTSVRDTVQGANPVFPVVEPELPFPISSEPPSWTISQAAAPVEEAWPTLGRGRGGWGVGLHLEEGGARGRLRETQPRPPGSPCGLLRPIPSISTRESCAVWLNVGSSGAGGNASLGPGRLLCRPTEKSPRGDKAWVWKGGGMRCSGCSFTSLAARDIQPSRIQQHPLSARHRVGPCPKSETDSIL